MNWYRTSQKDINSRLKDIIKSSPFICHIFDQNGVPLNFVDDNLSFVVKDLGDKNAKSNSDTIYFNKRLFENGDFFTEGIHYLIHELYHWLCRQREKTFYLADPEETEAFSYGIAYMMYEGKSMKEITQIYFPIINKHFDRKEKAKEVMVALLNEAKKKLKSLK